MKFESTKSLASTSSRSLGGALSENGDRETALHNVLTFIAEQQKYVHFNRDGPTRPCSVNEVTKEFNIEGPPQEIDEMKNSGSDYSLPKSSDNENYVTLKQLCEEFGLKRDKDTNGESKDKVKIEKDNLRGDRIPKEGSINNKDDRRIVKDGTGSFKKEKKNQKGGRDTSKGGTDTSKDGKETSKEGKETSKEGKETSKGVRDTTKGGRDTFRAGRDIIISGRDKIEQEMETIINLTVESDNTKSARDKMESERDITNEETKKLEKEMSAEENIKQNIAYADEVCLVTPLDVESENCSNMIVHPVDICSVNVEINTSSYYQNSEHDAGETVDSENLVMTNSDLTKSSDTSYSDLSTANCTSESLTSSVSTPDTVASKIPRRKTPSRIPISPARIAASNNLNSINNKDNSNAVQECKIPPKSKIPHKNNKSKLKVSSLFLKLVFHEM